MVEVNLYLWIGLIVGLVFSIVYVNNLLKRMRTMEAIFVASMDAVAQDVMALEDKINKNEDEDKDIREEFNTLKEWLQDNYKK